jgi:hypothetical protein
MEGNTVAGPDPRQAGIDPGKHALFTILDTTPDVYDYRVEERPGRQSTSRLVRTYR